MARPAFESPTIGKPISRWAFAPVGSLARLDSCPRSGSQTLSDLAAPRLEVACEKCGRGTLMDFATDFLQNRIVHAVLRFKGILGLLGHRELLILLRSSV